MERLKQFVKRNFLRYPVSGIYMLLAMLLTFIALFKGVALYNQLMAGVQDGDKYGYIYGADVNLNVQSENISYKKLFEGISSNAYVQVNMGLDKENASYLVQIYYNMEDNKMTFLEGSMPSKAGVKEGTAAVVIGKHHKKYCEISDGKRYISINGEKYLVTGIVGSKNSDYLDYNVITEYQYLAKEATKQIATDFISDAAIESDNSLYEDIEIIKENANAIGVDVEVVETFANSNAYNDDGLTSMYTFMYVFCLVNCVVASEFFVWERYNEIIIRKTYGFKTLDIFSVLFKDVLKLSGVAGILGMIINLIINYFEYGLDRMFSNISFEYLAMSLFMVLVSCFVIVLLPLYKAAKIMPAQLLK